MSKPGAKSETAFERSLREARDGGPKQSHPARRSQLRLAFVGGVFMLSMTGAAFKLADLAASAPKFEPAAPPLMQQVETGAPRRREIADRNGLTLAGDLRAYELNFDGANLSFAEERLEVAADLAKLFPEFDAATLAEKLAPGRRFPLKRLLTPRQAQAAHDLGWPCLYLRERNERVFFADRLTAHVLGSVDAEGVGREGLEGALDGLLRAGGPALLTSLDLRMQRALHDALTDAMLATGAKAAAGVILSPRTGEVLAMISLPDYDPHLRPQPPGPNEPAARSPLFDHAVQGLYELGSVMKLETWALALEKGEAHMDDVYDPPTPFEVDGYTINDDHPIRQKLSFPMALAKSSNIVAARLALAAGRQAQYDLFQALGLHAPTGIELVEARGVSPDWPAPWSDSTTAAAGYGHGPGISLLHMATATASLINGGLKVTPTLLKRDAPPADRPRVVRAQTSGQMRDLMRLVVTDGTGRSADAPGLEVGGKTGTAEKPKPGGGYDPNRVVASFVAAFPMSAPKAVVAVLLDEPEVTVDGEARRSASYTAAPAARQVIERIAPFLGVVPHPDAPRG